MSSRREPTISVIVPAFNRGTTLAATLDSLLAQSRGDWQAIVVDDGSEDDTAAVAADYAARDGRIELIRQANGGVSRARNTAIAAATAPWTFFLDADDWIAPDAFELLTAAAAAAEPGAGAVVGTCVRVDDAGAVLNTQPPVQGADLFPLFARTCAIVIHSCLVGTELIRRAGGFDESLVTCEDWDLWQRIARLGAGFASVPETVAFYRMRADSASRGGWRMLRDGFRVIDRGHGEDPRLEGDAGAARPELSSQGRDTAKTYFACYAAGLEIAGERDPREMVGELGDALSAEVDPDGVASTLFLSIPDGRATAVTAWPSYPAAVHELCREFIATMGAKLVDHWFTFSGWNALERLILAETAEERPRVAGRWYLMDLDVEGAPPVDLSLEDGVERLLCRVDCGGDRLGDLEVPVVDGRVLARVLADAVVAAYAWDILQLFFERHVYPDLEIEAGGGRASVTRGGTTIFAGALDPSRTVAEGVHDRIGWPLFLQETWSRPALGADDFYDGSLGGERGPRRAVAGGRVEFDVAEPPPTLRARGRGPIAVAVSVAGVPLTLVECPAPRGRVSAHRLRREVLMQTGYELCRAVLREAVVLAPAAETGSFGERLRAALARGAWEGVPADTAVVGRGRGPEGSAVSRWTAFPAAAAELRLGLAAADDDPVTVPDGGGFSHVLSAPVVLDPERRRDAGLSDDSLLRSIEFEELFGAGDDPWDYESAYEREKYELTLGLLPGGVRRALELGAAEGAFTHRLAGRCAELTAADISLIALARARARCADRTNVEFAQMDAFAGSLGGPYDLVVCSETLYYADDRPMLDRAARALAAALEPGGHLLTAHAHAVVDDPGSPGFDWDIPFGAAGVESALLATGLFALEREVRTTAYRVQLYSRRRRRRRFPVRSRARRSTAVPVAELPRNSARFLRHGGSVHKDSTTVPAATATRLPILMYHRVAPAGHERTRRWRLHPDDFEAQLSHLREQGFQSLTFAQWRAASDRRRPIPERSVMLTFDDGYADFPEFALPLLAKYGFQATMFVVTDLVGKANAWDEGLGERLELMDWPALVDVVARGVELGSHSAAHRPLIALSAEELARDLCRSRESFHEHLGVAVRSLCYPYGLHDAAVVSLAGACGFHYGVTTNEWHASFGDELLRLPRLEVWGTETVTEFAAKLAP